nr:ATP-dependent DNA helicase UvrD2 [Nakamurella aerolata]
MLDALDEGQRAAVLAPSGPVCVLAGAGTGKTRTITHRIAHLVRSGAHPVSEVLAVTFTTRAAGEMRLRLRSLGVPGAQARTFHSAALKQLRYFWPRAVGGQLWPVLENKMRLVATAARRAGAGTDTATLRDLAGEIEWAKACLATPESYQQLVTSTRRDTPVPVEQAAKVFDGYEALKNQVEQLDFDDLLLQTCAVLETDESVTREFRSRYRCFVVDEYQDVTPLQQRLLDAWLGERDQLTVVGDANQTIYSFAGASPRYLLGFQQRFPQAAVLRLERDYRSTPQVVELANKVIGAAGAAGPAGRFRLRLRAVLPDGPEASFTEHADEPAEANAVAAAIATLIEVGTPASAIAVLYRINAQSESYEQALTAAGVPYVVRGGERFFARPEVRQAMVTLRRAANQFAAAADASADAAADPDAAAGAEAGTDGAAAADAGAAGADAGAGAGAAGAAAADGAGRAGDAGAVADSAGDAGAADGAGAAAPDAVRAAPDVELIGLVRGLLAPIGLSEEAPPAGALRDKWESLRGVVSIAEDLASGATAAGNPRPLPVRLGEFVRELEQRAEAQHAPTVEGVTLASLHAAKGLEWDAVFLVGLADGTLPIQHAESPAEVEEERRLFYVGITRARRRLALSWALSRTEGGRRSRRRSRFLVGIAPQPAPSGRGRAAGRCRLCGGRLTEPAQIKIGRCANCPSSADPELVDALRQWRRQRSTDDDVPAYVVFSDATLLAIAEHRPADEKALRAIPGIGPSKLENYGREVISLVTSTR